MEDKNAIYIHSKALAFYAVMLTPTMGLATPLLMHINRQQITRSYSIIWANLVSWGICNSGGLRYKIVVQLPKDGKPRIFVRKHQSSKILRFKRRLSRRRDMPSSKRRRNQDRTNRSGMSSTRFWSSCAMVIA